MEQWKKTYHGIKYRCETEGQHYNKNGIKCLITKDELKELWHRDKGWLLKRPSIDRIDPKGHYIFANCRYIEFDENMRRVDRKIVQRNVVGQIVSTGRKVDKPFTKRWALNYDRCEKCGTTEFRHKGYGFCKPCFYGMYEKTRDSKLLARNIKKFRKALLGGGVR